MRVVAEALTATVQFVSSRTGLVNPPLYALERGYQMPSTPAVIGERGLTLLDQPMK